jgi:hypothetical protein
LRAEIRSGKAQFERKLAVCSGAASLSPEDRVELLTVLAADPVFTERASSTLLSQPLEAFLTALGRPDAASQLFTYCADNLSDKSGIADAMAKNPACPPEELVRVARHLSAAGVQALLDDLERLTSAPVLIAALNGCGAMRVEQRDLLQDLPKGAAPQPELEEAVAAAEPDMAKRLTLLQRLSRMTVVERVQLGLKGNREERMALIRDPNKMVQRAVLQSPRLTEAEVESFSAMSSLTAEVLRVISMSRIFMKNYTIVRNLTSNPKTPLEISLHLLPRLTARDLKLLTTNKNIPENLRTMALKLHRQRNEVRQSG